jgi:hypothetical protein
LTQSARQGTVQAGAERYIVRDFPITVADAMAKRLEAMKQIACEQSEPVFIGFAGI